MVTNLRLSGWKCVYTLAALFTLLLVASPRAQAGTIFVGIGNNEFQGDIPNAVNSINPFGATVITATNQDQGILTNISNGAAKLNGNNPDAFIFYYAGHGGTQADPNDKGDTDWIMGTSTDGGATFPNNPVTDDQLTSAISAINGAHPSAGVLVVLDSCFAGQAVADTADLASVDADVIGTADKSNCAPGTSKFLPLWQQAFQIVNGDFVADTDHNHQLTLGELFDYTKTIPNGGENPFGTAFGSVNQNAIVAVVTTPEPASILLLGTGLLAAALLLKKRVRQRSQA